MSYFERNPKKITILHWLVLFFLGNLCLYWVIGLAYLSQLSWYGYKYLVPYQKFGITLFVFSSYVSHLALLGLWPLLILVPLLWLGYWPRLMISISFVIAVISASLLLIDVFIYASYRFHLNSLIIQLAWSSLNQNVFGMARIEIIVMAVFICILSCLECCYALWLWRFLNKKSLSFKYIGWNALALAICFYISYSAVFYVFYSATVHSTSMIRLRLFLEVARFLPGYLDVLNLLVFNKTATVSKRVQKITLQSAQINIPLKYPLKKLEFESSKKPMNLIVIVLDTWRFDVFNDQVTPNIYRFGKKSWVFSEHVSGGNATGPGIFSLFYGIPATYWTAMQSQHRSPVLLDRLQKTYDIKVISSGELNAPPLNQTVFHGVKNLQENQQPGNTPRVRDEQVTQQFKLWIAEPERFKKPFFTFLFYDSAHCYCDAEYKKPFKVGDCNRLLQKNRENLFVHYKNAAYFVDQQVQEVIATLEAHALLKNTVIIITADHGEEFDDNHLGYWGHGSNYTPYQIKVPLIVYWPGQSPQLFSHQTSHFDVVPTLMTRLLGCKTQATHYTIGKDLLDKTSRFPLIISSYIDFAMVESAHVTRMYSAGNYQIENHQGEVTHGDNINVAAMNSAFRDFTHFN